MRLCRTATQLTGVVVLVTLGGCTAPPRSRPSDTTADVTAPAPDPRESVYSTPSTTIPPPLAIPPRQKGEIARRAARFAGVATPSARSEILADPREGVIYAVDTACTSTTRHPTVLHYRVVDALAAHSSRAIGQRIIMETAVTCDGKPHRDGAGPLSVPVTVEYLGDTSAVAGAWTTITVDRS